MTEPLVAEVSVVELSASTLSTNSSSRMETMSTKVFARRRRPETPTTVTVTASAGTPSFAASDAPNASASKVSTSPLTVASNWTASTIAPPGGTAGDGGGSEGGGGEGGGESVMQRRMSGGQVGGCARRLSAGLQ